MSEAELEAQALAYRAILEAYMRSATTPRHLQPTKSASAFYEAGLLICKSQQPARGKALLANALANPKAIPWDALTEDEMSFMLHGLAFIPLEDQEAAFELLTYLASTARAKTALLYVNTFLSTAVGRVGDRTFEQRKAAVPQGRALLELYQTFLP